MSTKPPRNSCSFSKPPRSRELRFAPRVDTCSTVAISSGNGRIPNCRSSIASSRPSQVHRFTSGVQGQLRPPGDLSASCTRWNSYRMRWWSKPDGTRIVRARMKSRAGGTNFRRSATQLIISKLRVSRFTLRQSSRARRSVTSTRRTHAPFSARGSCSVSRKSRSVRRLSRGRHLHQTF